MEYCTDPDNFADFVTECDVSGKINEYIFNELNGEIREESIAKFMESFATGVYWVFEKEGTIPPEVRLNSEPDFTVRLTQETDGNDYKFYIEIGLDYLERYAKYIDNPAAKATQSKTMPYNLSITQHLECVGVEEAYHYAQLTKYRDSYFEEVFEDTMNVEDYNNHPLEKDAEMKAVRPYLKEVYGLDKLPENHVSPEEAVHMWLMNKGAVMGLA